MSLLTVSDLSRSFGSGAAHLEVLKGLSFSMEQGELVALMGPSGCGKSTLLNIVGGLLEAQEGTITLGDHTYGQQHPRTLTDLRRRGIGWIFQDFHLIDHLSSRDNILLALEMAGIHGEEARRRADHALDRVGLTDRAENIPDALSGGQRQRVAIARAIAGDRLLLLADEPTGNLDRASGQAMMKLFHELCSDPKEPATLLMVTHDPELARKADRMLLLKDGQVKAADIDETWKEGA